MIALALSLLLAGRSVSPREEPPAKPGILLIVVDAGVPDAGAPPLDDQDRRLLDDLELLRQWKLLQVYPLIAPQ